MSKKSPNNKSHAHNSSFDNPVINSQDIYEGGGFSQINTKDLLNNEVAIKQLINDHNFKAKELEEARTRAYDLQSDLEYQKTSSAFAIFSMIVNIIGSILIGIGGGLLNIKDSNLWLFLMILGGLLLITGNLMNILHKRIRNWSNGLKHKQHKE